MPPTLYWWLFCMRKSREKSDTIWKAHHNNDETFWNSRIEANTEWEDSGRNKHKTKKRDYMLGSFFAMVLTAITDTKDGKAIKIKTDPAYLHDSNYGVREEATTQWKVRFRS